jgi:hypothetical protein
MRAHMITWFGASFLATMLGSGCQQQPLRNDFEVQGPPAATVPNLSASVASERPARSTETAVLPSEPATPVRGTVVRVEFAEPEATSQAAAAPGPGDMKQDQTCSRDAAEKSSGDRAAAAVVSGTSPRCTGTECYVVAGGPALPGSETSPDGRASDKAPATPSAKDAAPDKRLDSNPEEMRVALPTTPVPELPKPGKVAEKTADAKRAPEKRLAAERRDKQLAASSSTSGPELAGLDKPAEKVAAAPLATAEEHLQAKTAEQSLATGAASASGGHAADYRWVCGELQYSPFDKTWRVRYARVDEVDPYGGSVTLVDEAHATSFKEGQIVRVEGFLLRPNGNAIAPRYEVRSLRVIGDKD